MKNNIAFFLPNLYGGGAERAVINLLKGLREKDSSIPLDLVLGKLEGAYVNQIPKQVRVINFSKDRVIKSIIPLNNYLQEVKPQALVSQMSHANVIVTIAKYLSQTETRLILVEQNNLSHNKSKLFRGKFVPFFMKLVYPYADEIIGVSHDVSRDLENQLNLPKGRVKTIYNPIVDDDLIYQANLPITHSWFEAKDYPTILAVGRLTEQKDFATLIEGFAILRKKRMVRLIILGEGELREDLEKLVTELGISKDVIMPGFVDNPYQYMKNADVFVLSSKWEGFGNVIVEAMACGCPVVSTNCPSGPGEILASGKYGSLVPTENPEALSEAILNVLNQPIKPDILKQRAENFSIKESVSKYCKVIGI
ncbi:MAG: glycosyltransferase [Cyanobacteria bacterium J06635_10]